MRATFLFLLCLASTCFGAEFAAPDAAYRCAVPDGWRAKYTALLTVLEPTSGGGTSSSTLEATGSQRIHGSTLVADMDGYGRYLFACEPYGNGAVKLNGQLFMRQ